MNSKKRILALLMCICMIFTLLPFSALADSTGSGNGGADTGASAGAPVTEPPVTEPPAPAAKELYVDAAEGNDTTGNGTEANPYQTVGRALEQTANNGTYTIHLGAGEYSSYTSTAAKDKKLTLTFIGDSTDTTVYKMGTSEDGTGAYEDGDYSLQGNDKVTFEKMTLLSSVTPSGKMVTRNYTGFIRIQHIVVNNCVVEGRTTYWGYTDTEFHNTTFYAPGHEALNSELLLGTDNKTDYSLWTCTGNKYIFDHCTFNSSGKVINVYTDYGAGKYDITVDFQNCTVVSTNLESLSVMNINDSNMGSFKYTINFSGNNTVTGIKADGIVLTEGSHATLDKTGQHKTSQQATCSKLFEFNMKYGNGNTGRTVVNIDGTPVWEDGKMVSHAIDTANDKYTDGYKDNAITETTSADGKTVTKTCKYCGWTESYTKQDWNIIVSKTATNLDKDAKGDYKTNVTLSVPGVEKNLNSDVVFVLDTSDCVGNVMDQVKTLVEKLKTLSSEKKVNIKVGVVAFKGSAAAMFGGNLVSVDKAVEDLNKMIADVAAVNKKDEKEAAVVKYLNDNEDFIKKGSNLHSGLLAAQKLLDGDKEVDNDRKYLITVTDGLTYYWNDDQGNVYGIYCGTASENSWGAELVFNQWGPAFGVDTNSGTWKISSDSPIKNWDNYIENVRSRITADNDKYTANVRKAMTDLNLSASAVRLIPGDKMDDFNTAGYSCIPNSELKTHAHGIERSIVACIDTYKQLVTSDYNCYVVNTSTNEFPALVTSELNKLAGVSGQIDFNTIENKILYAVDAGSYVVDVIGDDFTLDQDSLKVGICTIKEDGTKEVKYLNSFKTDPDADGNWTQYFGDSDAPTTLMEHYRFMVAYDAASKTLTWTFNEKVSNFAPVQLSYTLQLTQPATAPGTYGQLDLNGDGYIDGKDTEIKVDPEKAIYTNNNATLTPVDSDKHQGAPVTFPMPSVEYYIPQHWNIPVSKTATVLTKDADGNYKTDVTISLITRNDIDETSVIGVGSTIVDKIGKDFKLVDSDNIVINTIREIDGYSVDLKHVKVPGENGAWTSYYGLDNPISGDVVGADYYMFMLTYDGKDTLKLTFNNCWGDGNVISMTYALQLIKPETAPGHYGKLDLDGSNYDKDAKYPDVLYTNEYATLTPVDSDGHENLPVKFPMPSVEYTVRNPYRPPVNPGIGDEIIVEITGNSDSVVYDGTEHNVKGYTVEISDSRYTEKDFTFSGKDIASGVNAGTYEMGLKAEQFKNTNARFTNVKFVIKADGVLTITPMDLTITAGSKDGIAPVTCNEYENTDLAKGDVIESVKITGEQLEPGQSPNVASDAVIKNAKGEDVTKNYNIKYVDGTLKAVEPLNKEDHFNYIVGYTDGTIRPNNNITRAEVAAIFFRLLTDEARSTFMTDDCSFSDVAQGAWCRRSIATLTNAEIISGYTDGTFKPNAPITRAELATIIARFAKLDVNTKTFSDINGHWAQKYIEQAAGNGWIDGYTDGTFRPNQNIKRAETFAMINRVLDRVTESNSDLLPTDQMNMWSDNMDFDAWYYRDVQEATNNHKAERVGDSIYEKWTEKLPDIDWAAIQL